MDLKLPRKIKKKILGRKLTKSKLRKLLSLVEVVKGAKTMFETPEVKPYLFCPNCGCRYMYGSGNKVGYPEHWEYFYCLRCDEIVASIDNSPFIHILETWSF